MKRRVLAPLAAASVVLVIGVACSNGGSSTPEATGGGSSATTNPADVTGTIRLLSYSDGFDPKYLASFHQEYPNIKLETASMDSNEAAIAKIQAGFQVDVINS